MKNLFSPFEEVFWYGETDMKMFLDYPYRIAGGLVLLCTQGEAIIYTGVLENKIIKNTEMIILPGTTLYLISASETFTAKIFTFSKDLYDEVGLRTGASFSRYLRDTPFYVYPEESNLLRNAYLWMDMADLIYKEGLNRFKDVMEKNFLQSYLLYLYDKCQSYFGHLIGNYTRQQDLFHQFLSLLDTHCREYRDVTFYANTLCITPRYLRKITNTCTSFESPKDVIDKRFIVEIKVLLQSFELSIQEIAERLSFPDQSYLGRYFKRITDMSPSEYRNRIRVAY